MKLQRSVYQLLRRIIWYSITVFLVLTVTAYGVARLYLLNTDEHRIQLEQQVSSYLGQSVKIQTLDAAWHRFIPSLLLKNVQVYRKDDESIALQLDTVRVDVDVFSSLASQSITVGGFELDMPNLTLVHNREGRIEIPGITMPDNSAIKKHDQVDILLQKRNFGVNIGRFKFVDKFHNKYHQDFSNVGIVLRNRRGTHLLDGIVEMPSNPLQELVVSAKIRGNPITDKEWGGSIHFSTNEIDMASVLRPFVYEGKKYSVGVSTVDIVSKWEKGRIIRLEGNLALNNVRISQLKAASNNKKRTGFARLHYDKLAADFKWIAEKNRWSLQAKRFYIKSRGRKWMPSRLDIVGSLTTDDKTELELKAGFIRIQDVLPLAAIYFPQQTMVEDAQQHYALKADLRNVDLLVSGMESPKFHLKANISDLSNTPHANVPGLKNVSAKLEMSNSVGNLILDSKESEYYQPDLFRWKLPVSALKGDISWIKENDLWRIETKKLRVRNEDLDATVSAKLDIGNGKAPLINLGATIHRANGDNISPYLPLKVINKETLAWLDKSILKGDVLTGGVVIRGRVDEFPFDNGNGAFEVRFKVKNAQLDYAENWPPIDNIEAEVLFKGRQLEIESRHAKMSNLKLKSTRFSIKDLGGDPLKMNINGTFIGSTQDKIDQALAIPVLSKQLDGFLPNVQVDGDSELFLDVNLQLGGATGVQSSVTGNINFVNNTISILQQKNFISNASGKINILKNGIQSDKIKANIIGSPSTIELNTVDLKGNSPSSYIDIFAQGKFQAQELAQRYAPVLSDLVDGESDWTIVFKVPSKLYSDISEERDKLRISLKSDLKGVRIKLPEPFNKQAKDSIHFGLLASVAEDSSTLVRADYGGRLDAIYKSKMENGKLVSRGEVMLGGGPVVLPKQEGVVIKGQLDTFSYEIWSNLIEQFTEHNNINIQNDSNVEANLNRSKEKVLSNKTQNNADSDAFFRYPELSFSTIRNMDVRIREFTIFGQLVNNIRIKAKGNGERLDMILDSESLAGSVFVPINTQQAPIEMDLDHWYLKSSTSSSGGAIDPRNVPNIKVNAKNVRYEDRRFGKVALEISSKENGLILDQLIIKPRSTTIRASGKWLILDGKPKSEFNLNLKTKNIGRTMKDLGYSGSIKGGNGTMDVNLSWPGALTDVDLDNLQGNVEFELKEGVILELDPGGAARMFGLLSLQTLPKRLMLDFSDIYSKGLGFDIMKGHFSIEDGDAYTKNQPFYMDGPTAKVTIRGGIGLASRTFDQNIVVIPKVLDKFSLLTLIASQPILFFVTELLKEDVNKAVGVEYTLTGKWTDYKLEPKLKPAKVYYDEEDEDNI